jgi:hypothetical protein
MLQRHTIDTDLPTPSLTALLPVMATVFIAFLIIGFALPVLPLHVHHGLGLSMFVVGSSQAANSRLPSSRASGPATLPIREAPSRLS